MPLSCTKTLMAVAMFSLVKRSFSGEMPRVVQTLWRFSLLYVGGFAPR